MYLCVDENGRVYQSASYRADGRGFEREADLVDSGDVCLGSPYLKHNVQTKNEWDMLQKFNVSQDERDLKARSQRRQVEEAYQRAEHENLLKMQVPAFRAKLTKEAALQTMSGADFSTNSVWGYSSGRFANGMGRSEQEILRESALLQGMGEVPSEAQTAQLTDSVVNVDPYEIEQYYLNQETNKMIVSEGEKAALNRERELYQQKLMTTKANIDSTQDSQLVEKTGTYIEDEKLKASEGLKKAGFVLGAIALINLIRG